MIREDPMLEYWIDWDGELAEVAYRNCDTERTLAYVSKGPLALQKAQVWALENGLGEPPVRRDALTQVDERLWRIGVNPQSGDLSVTQTGGKLLVLGFSDDGRVQVPESVDVVPKSGLVEVERERDEAKAEGYREALEKLLEWAEHGEGLAPSGIRFTEAVAQARAALRPSSGESP